MSDHSPNRPNPELAAATVSWWRVIVVLCAIVVTAVGVVWFVANGKTEDSAEVPARVMPVRAAAIQLSHAYQVDRTFTGTVVTRRASELAFERTAKLIAVLRKEGDRVSQGQELARLDQRLLEKLQSELAARKRAADARLAELLNGSRQEVKDAARADLAALTAQHKLDSLAFKRQEELKVSGATTSDEYDRARLALAASKGRMDSAQERLNEVLTGPRKEIIDAQRATVDELNAALENVAVQIKQSTLVAPFGGTIVARYLDEGAIATPQAPVLRLVEDTSLEIRIGIPVEFVNAVPVGSTYEILVERSPVNAVVVSVLPEVDRSTRTRIALMDLVRQKDEELPEIVDGQLARIELKQSIEQSGFWLPMTALTRSTRGLWSVYAVVTQPDSDQQIAERREVEVLHTTGNRVFVRGTLQDGDNIITSGLQRIVPGQLVSVTEANQPSLGSE